MEWLQTAVQEKIEALQPLLCGEVSFGIADVDEEQDWAKEIQLMNVPCVAYYEGTKLVATVIGIGQDIGNNLDKIKRRESLETSNNNSRK